jgi:hypothetical protein
MSITPGPWRVGSWQGSCSKKHPGRDGHPGPGGADGCVYDYKFVEASGGDYMPGIAGPAEKMVVDTCYDSLSIKWDDAKLIAAAPDLAASCYEFLPILYRQLESININGADEGSVAFQMAKGRVDRMRDALAKSGYVPPQANPEGNVK